MITINVNNNFNQSIQFICFFAQMTRGLLEPITAKQSEERIHLNIPPEENPLNEQPS